MNNKLLKLPKMRFPYWMISTFVILFSVLIFQNLKTQGVNWTYPYLSGAANYEQLFVWKISVSDFEVASKISENNYRFYKHQKSEDTTINYVNNYGYLLVVLMAKKLMPYLGDIQAIIIFQIMVHIIACLILLNKVFSTPFQRNGFLFLYAANPLIIHLVTFPFYYFWLFIPPFALISIYFRQKSAIWLIWVLTPILLFSILIRPTSLFLCIFFYLVAWWLLVKLKVKHWNAPLALLIFIFCVAWYSGKNTGSPAHTMYVGVGAYPNQLGVPDLGDNRGYEYFYSVTGIEIDTSAVGGNWNNNDVRSLYNKIIISRYLEMVKDSPLVFFRNAFLNTMEAFSVGYIVNYPYLTLISFIIGISVFIFLLSTGQYVWIVGILTGAMGYVWYFPPIPAYNFSSYSLLAIGLIMALEKYHWSKLIIQLKKITKIYKR